MDIKKQNLLDAAKSADINPQQIDLLWDALQLQTPPGKTALKTQEFDTAKVTYYVGAFIALFSLPVFVGQLWDRFGFGGAFTLFLAYAAAFAFFAMNTKKDQQTARGVLWTLCVFMVPFIIYYLQQLLGMWPDISVDYGLIGSTKIGIRNMLMIAAGTLIAGMAVLRYIRLPLLLFPISLAIWLLFLSFARYMAFDTFLDDDSAHKWASLAAGLTLIGLGILADIKKFITPFWLYLIGLLALESALILFLISTENNRIIFYFINLFLLFCSLALNSRVFAVVVSLTLCAAFFSLYYFDEHHSLTQLAFIILGIGVIFFGWLANKREFLPAFWFYLLGLTGFEIGLSILRNGNELNYFFFALINFFLIFLSLFFESHIFSLFGTVAIFVYLVHLTTTIFSDSFLFPFVLIAIGATIFVCGMLYSRYYDRLRHWINK